MPFKSKKQLEYMFAKHPEIAKKFASETPSFAKLPMRVTKKNPKVEKYHSLRGKK